MSSPKQSTSTAKFDLKLTITGSETDTIHWTNDECPLSVIAARQAILLGAFAEACKKQANGDPIV